MTGREIEAKDKDKDKEKMTFTSSYPSEGRAAHLGGVHLPAARRVRPCRLVERCVQAKYLLMAADLLPGVVTETLQDVYAGHLPAVVVLILCVLHVDPSRVRAHARK